MLMFPSSHGQLQQYMVANVVVASGWFGMRRSIQIPDRQAGCWTRGDRCPPRAGAADPQREDDIVEAKADWQFWAQATLGYSDAATRGTEVIGDISFDGPQERFATGGIGRKVRVYSLQAVLEESKGEAIDEGEEFEEQNRLEVEQWCRRGADLDQDRSAVRIICTPARLSSVQWAAEAENVIGCGDYDGVVAEWDVERGVNLTERDEHGGSKVRSIAYSLSPPHLCASASDDGTVRLWTRTTRRSSGVLQPPSPSPVCSAIFHPSSAHSVALACANAALYLFDLRQPSCPLLALRHHSRAASYVRFLPPHCLVSASIDSTLKLWDLSRPVDANPSSTPTACVAFRSRPPQLVRTFAAHTNVRNFVGLSVLGHGGLLACGSETNQVFVYDCRWTPPVSTHEFQETHRESSSGDQLQRQVPKSGTMVSAVCWRQHSSDVTLLAANSDGFLKILTGQRGSL